jgi:hypothetical protein
VCVCVCVCFDVSMCVCVCACVCGLLVDICAGVVKKEVELFLFGSQEGGVHL